jgi:hypothetical protein
VKVQIRLKIYQMLQLGGITGKENDVLKGAVLVPLCIFIGMAQPLQYPP